MANKKYIFANWKMCMGLDAAQDFAQGLIEQLVQEGITSDCEICLFPSFPHLGGMAYEFADTPIALGAQDCATWEQGAYTGEVSATMLSELGCEYVLIGHSERRRYFGEQEEMLRAKIDQAQAADLMPVLCVGEDLNAHDEGETEAVIKQQLEATLTEEHIEKGVIISYEPIWAIGSGKIPTIASIEAVHQMIRITVKKLGNKEPKAILYGGSVKPDNASELLESKYIDGVLVGGASLDVASFWKICKS